MMRLLGGFLVCGALAIGLGAGCADENCVDEVCNGLDDNCDGTTDEGLSRDCTNSCGAGSQACTGGTWGTCSAPVPGVEACNGRDDDCDGLTDEGGREYYLDEDGDTYGGDESQTACTPPAGYVIEGGDCNDDDDTYHPGAAEPCDGEDQDCDTTPDNGCDCTSGDTQACGSWGDLGPCELGTQTCAAGGEWGACTGGVRPGTESCNGIDDDCDGTSDEGLGADAHEPNDTCAAAKNLGTVNETGSLEPMREITDGGTLYKPDGSPDTDWFVVPTLEDSAACVPFTSECCYRFTVQLIPPEGIPRENLRVCLYDGSCGGTERCSTGSDWLPASGAYERTSCWSGSCGSEDGQTMYMKVEGVGSPVSTCKPYRLRFNFYRTGSDC